MKQKNEIERRWILKHNPVEGLVGVHIFQGYLSSDKDSALRLRQKGEDKYFIALKGEGTISRPEWETIIPEWVFKKLWLKVDDRILEKNRHALNFEGHQLEVNIYTGRLKGLIMVELEFKDLETANNFIFPLLSTSLEVTEDSHYENFSLAINGLPDDFPFKN